jgi:hypothetical protein
LPQDTFRNAVGFVPHQQPVHQSGDQVGAKRETRGQLALALVFVPSALEEGRVAQNIGRRLDLTEELLRREQIASFR